MQVDINADGTFLNLLSSQRQLLAQIAREGRESSAKTTKPDIPPAVDLANCSFPEIRNNAHTALVSPYNSNCESSTRIEGLALSKRFSLGFGGSDIRNFPPASVPSNNHPSKADFTFGCDSTVCDDGLAFGSEYHKRDKINFDLDPFSVPKRRRLSDVGLLFLDELPRSSATPDERRLSLSSLGNDSLEPTSSVASLADDFAESEGLLHTFDQAAIEFTNSHFFHCVPSSHMFQARSRPTFSAPQDTRKMMVDLSEAMERTQKSQQDIHDWDKKMGLKRSHSKTMRLTMRSRKKLRNMLKKQINQLTPKKR